MRRLFLLLVALAPVICFGQTPEWWGAAASAGSVTVPAASADYQFTTGSLSSDITVTRSGTNAYYFNSSNLLTQAAANTPRFDYSCTASYQPALRIEESRTNQALYSRDFTQSAWAKTSITAALNQVGLDGASNSASSLTATAANATVLQSITQSAANSVFSVYLKRITGTGTIQLTQDGGSTYTTVTLTTAWTRFNLTAESTANPSFGVKIATSGDAVAADAAQFEAGLFPTTPILTTSATATRSADIVNVPNSNMTWYNQSQGALIVEFYDPVSTATSNRGMWAFSDGTGSNRIEQFFGGSPQIQSRIVTAGASANPVTFTNERSPGLNKVGIVYNTGTNAAFAGLNGSNINYASPASLPSKATLSNGLNIGRDSANSIYADACFGRVRYWNAVLTPTQFKAVTH